MDDLTARDAIIADQRRTIEALYFALNERNAIVRQLSAEVASLRQLRAEVESLRNALRIIDAMDTLLDENMQIAVLRACDLPP